MSELCKFEKRVHAFNKAHYLWLLSEVEFIENQINLNPGVSYWPLALIQAKRRLVEWKGRFPDSLEVSNNIES